MAGFDNDVVYGKNINFDSLAALHPGIITIGGQLLIGIGHNGTLEITQLMFKWLIT